MKFDLHIHSNLSPDSPARIEDIVSAAKARGLHGVAIADHNRFVPRPQSEGLLVIPACEYSTDAGHLLTYFLSSPLEDTLRRTPSGVFAWQEVLEAAHAQGALVFVAHPYAPNVNRPAEFWDRIDGIEVYNARIEHSRARGANQSARETCLLTKKPFSAGSDGHYPGEVGVCYWECDINPAGKSPELLLDEVKQALLARSGRVFRGAASPLYRPRSQFLKLRRQRAWKKLAKLLPRFVRAGWLAWKRKIGIMKYPSGYLDMK